MIVIKILGLLVGTGCAVIGSAFYFGAGDNVDARALAQFVGLPFLVVGAILLVASTLMLVL